MFYLCYFMTEENKKQMYPFMDYTLHIEERVEDIVSRMTLEEKVSQMFNDAHKIPRLNVPRYNWWNECLHGVASDGYATVFPQAIGLAATWNIRLMHTIATAISDEARAKHHENIRNGKIKIFGGLTFWSPNVNLFRDPRWGRGQETYGEDTFLSSRMGVAFVKGIQGDEPKYFKVIATPKHYVVHSGPEPLRHEFNAVVSKKDLYESYLPAFEACIKEGKAYSIMGAYNRTNGDPCCASKPLLQEILRDKWGFEGYVVSDCWAIQNIYKDHKVVETAPEAAALAINAGCDLFCNMFTAHPKRKKRYWQWMIDAIDQGLLTEETIDKSVKRLFMARFKLGMFDPLEEVKYQQIPFEVNDCEEHRQLALRAARECIVLLKNENNILPLNKNTKSIAVIGPNADSLSVLLGNYSGQPSKFSSFLQGIKASVSADTEIYFAKGCALTDRSKDGFEEAIEIAKKSEVVIIVLGISAKYESEEGEAKESEAMGDRVHMNLPGVQEDLLKVIHEIGRPIILVLTSGSALSVNFAKEHIPAIIHAWYPGEEGGKATTDVIFGDYNPAGRLPITFYKSVEQLPDFKDYSMENRTYKYFKGEPLYSFGYGLSYTKFKYGNLEVNPLKANTDKDIYLSVDIENIGKYSGDEVVQLYISNDTAPIHLPIRELKGFERIHLKPGEVKNVSFTLKPYHLSHITEDGKRILEPGKFTVSVGGCQLGFGEDNLNILISNFEVRGEVIEFD